MKNKRIERLRAEMRQRSLDAMLISCEENQSWCCNFDFTDGYLLIFDDKAYLITDGRYIEAAKAEADESFICVVPKTNIGETISAYLNEQGSVRVGIEDMEMSYYKVMALKGELYPCEVVMTGRMLDDLRSHKDEDEIECIKHAQRITDKAFSHILGYIKEGVSERDIALELEFFMRKNGADAVSFDIIVASGSASSRPHAVPRTCAIERGFVTIDMGCKYGGYCSDMTRTISFGPADAEMKSMYDTVLKAQLAALSVIDEGVRCAAVDKAARDILEREYPGAFSHGLGHGVGRRIHESPRLSPMAADTRLSRGHVVTVEPGVYIPGKYGVRIEDMVVIGERCATDITNSEKQLIEIW